MIKLNPYKLLFLFSFFTLFSCEGVILDTDILDQQVVLVTPYNKEQFSSASVTFSWESAAAATKCHLQIAKPNFEKSLQIVLNTVVRSTYFTQQFPIGHYEWRVSAVNSAYKTPFANHFITVAGDDNFQDNLVVLISPADNFRTKVAERNLKWTTIIVATGYQV